jgi:hypothetical protein
MAEHWSPPLRLTEVEGGCRLSVGGCAHGYGATLQEAADDLVRRLLELATCVRAGDAGRTSTDLPRVDVRMLSFLHEVGVIAEAGGDVRRRVFDPAPGSPQT